MLAVIVCVVLIALYAAFSYFGGSRMILAISRAQKADEKQYHYLYDIVEGLALASQIPMPDVYIINDPNPNAFATGRNKKHASVAVTTGLLAMMNKKELQGVIAHEMSHIADNDILYLMIAVVFAGVIGLVAAVVRNMFFFGGISGAGQERRHHRDHSPCGRATGAAVRAPAQARDIQEEGVHGRREREQADKGSRTRLPAR